MAFNIDIQTVTQHLLDITQSIDAHEQKNLSLLTGSPGRLLFHWYAAKSALFTLDEVKFNQQIDQLLASVSLLRNNINFGYGLAGYGWLLELLLTEQSDDYDPELNQEIDDYLTSVLQQSVVWNNDIEYVLGLSGIAVFAGRRLRQNQGLTLCSTIVKLFSEMAIYTSTDACAWSTPINSIYRFDKKYPETPEYNLGLAHGVPAVICALMPLINHPDIGLQAKKLVSDGCNWLIQQKLPEGGAGSLFSNCSGEHHQSRLGWCYGDLTIALTFARAGKALNRADLLDWACNVGMHAAKRKEASAMVADSGLCHGSAGLMLIFQLLHQIVPMPEFQQASDYWFDNTMQRYKTQGLEGFYANKSGKRVEETGLLEGYSGIGLCLLARQGVSPDWVDALLLA